MNIASKTNYNFSMKLRKDSQNFIYFSFRFQPEQQTRSTSHVVDVAVLTRNVRYLSITRFADAQLLTIENRFVVHVTIT